MDNLNIGENTINQLKQMLNKGDLSNIVSQIPPEMIQNFSDAVSNTSNENTNKSTENTNFDLNNIDMNTILKLQSVMSTLNKKDDPRSNLLYSLKPYLREEKKEKIDKYANLMNLTKVMDLLKKDDNLKENDKNA